MNWRLRPVFLCLFSLCLQLSDAVTRTLKQKRLFKEPPTFVELRSLTCLFVCVCVRHSQLHIAVQPRDSSNAQLLQTKFHSTSRKRLDCGETLTLNRAGTGWGEGWGGEGYERFQLTTQLVYETK